jgi:hypothetical protein
MQKMENFIKSLLSDNNEGISSSRVLLLSWGMGVLIIWIYMSVLKSQLQPLGNDIVTILIALSATKTIQRFGEK